MSNMAVPPIVRQGQLVQEIARDTALEASRGGDWDSLLLTVRSLAPYDETQLGITRPSGEDRSLLPPRDTSKLIDELRDVMYRPNAGTWFSMELTVTRQDGRGKVDVSFNYDEMPAWSDFPASIMFVQDLRRYPRDDEHTPGWLREQVERAQVEYPEESAKVATKFFRSYSIRPDGTTLDRALYRREREDDVTGDAVFQRDGKWHSTSDISMSLKGHIDIDLREISEAEAAQILQETFGDASLVHAPTVNETG